jgi:hypothetical protein
VFSMSRRSAVQVTRKMSSSCDLVISVQVTLCTTIEAFFANSDNVISANTFLSEITKQSLCAWRLGWGMILVRLAIKKFLRRVVGSKR